MKEPSVHGSTTRHDTDTILCIDKPEGVSSFDCIRVLRRALGVRKMGHAGTLDPQASGVLLVGVGKATKRMHALSGVTKTYRAHILLGMETTTGDREGTVISRGDPAHISEDDVRAVLSELTGCIDLPVPRYSAVKVDGKPLYKYAREGKEVPVPVRSMEVHHATFVEMHDTEEGKEIVCDLDVGSGVYIRSIAEEVGRRLGVSATLNALRRTRVGEYTLADAKPLTAYE